MNLIFRVLFSAVGLVGVAYLVPGIIVQDFWTAMLVALILGVMHAVLRPILVLLTLPITLLTFGLFVFVINAGIFALAAVWIDGFAVHGFIPAFLGSLLMSMVGTIGDTLFHR